MKFSVDGTPITFREFENTSFSLTTFLYPDGRTESCEVPMDKQLTLPIRLLPHDTKEGFVFFPFYPDTDKVSQSLKVELTTTKGKRKKYSKIWVHKTLIDDGDGPYYQ